MLLQNIQIPQLLRSSCLRTYLDNHMFSVHIYHRQTYGVHSKRPIMIWDNYEVQLAIIGLLYSVRCTDPGNASVQCFIQLGACSSPKKTDKSFCLLRHQTQSACSTCGVSRRTLGNNAPSRMRIVGQTNIKWHYINYWSWRFWNYRY